MRRDSSDRTRSCNAWRDETSDKIAATVENALAACIGRSRDGRGLPVPPLLSLIAAYSKPLVWNELLLVREPRVRRVIYFREVGVAGAGDQGRLALHRASEWLAYDIHTGARSVGPLPRHAGPGRRVFTDEFCNDPSEAGSMFVLWNPGGLYHVNEQRQSFVAISEMDCDFTLDVASSDGRSVWLSHYRDGTICRVDVLSQTRHIISHKFPFCTQLVWNRGPTVQPDTKLLIVCNANQLRRYDISLDQVSTLLNAGVLSVCCTETGHIIVLRGWENLHMFDPVAGTLNPVPIYSFSRPVHSLLLIDEQHWLIGTSCDGIVRVDVAPEFFTS